MSSGEGKNVGGEELKVQTTEEVRREILEEERKIMSIIDAIIQQHFRQPMPSILVTHDGKCAHIFMLHFVCVGDYVTIQAGRAWYRGRISAVSPVGLLIDRVDGKQDMVRVSKIISVTIEERGEISKKIVGDRR